MLTFIEQLISLVQAKPLLQNYSLMEYESDKIMDNISKISQILQTDGKMFGCLTKTNSRLVLFFPLLMFFCYGIVSDINCICCPHHFIF